MILAILGITSPVYGSVVTSASNIISAAREEVASIEFQELKVFGPSPMVLVTSVPPYLPAGLRERR